MRVSLELHCPCYSNFRSIQATRQHWLPYDAFWLEYLKREGIHACWRYDALEILSVPWLMFWDTSNGLWQNWVLRFSSFDARGKLGARKWNSLLKQATIRYSDWTYFWKTLMKKFFIQIFSLAVAHLLKDTCSSLSQYGSQYGFHITEHAEWKAPSHSNSTGHLGWCDHDRNYPNSYEDCKLYSTTKFIASHLISKNMDCNACISCGRNTVQIWVVFKPDDRSRSWK